MLAIIDYGMGNLRSVQKAFEREGISALITRERKDIEEAQGIVLPGVGAFRDCMENLERFHLLDMILKSIKKGKPFLGICLGMQVLMSQSEEFGLHKGLDLIKGKVVPFPKNMEDKIQNSKLKTQNSKLNFLKIPHMGWNTIQIKKRSPLFEGIKDGTYFYFVHSYYVVPECINLVTALTNYGLAFASAIAKDNVFATQFHPEKSQEMGLRLLSNFSRLVERC